MTDLFIILFFLAISFIGIKAYNKPEYNDNNFGIENCNSIKAICALVIIFCHLSNYINDSSLIGILDGLGTFAVTIFFMFSGYGVMKNYLLHSDYPFKLLLKRVKRILRPYLIVLILYILYYLANGYDLLYILKIDSNAFYTGDTIVMNSWFVFIIISMYFLFYLATKLFSGKKKIITFTFIICLISLIIMKRLNFCACWYISLLSFPFGTLYAYCDTSYNSIIKRYFLLFGICNLLLLAVCMIVNFTIFPNNSNIVFDQIKYLVFLNMIIIVTLKYSFNNSFLKIVYKVSYELYLIHGLVIMLVAKFINNSFVLCIFGITISIIFAYLINLLNTKLFKR